MRTQVWEKTPHPGNGSQAGLCRCFSLIYFIQANPYKHTIACTQSLVQA